MRSDYEMITWQFDSDEIEIYPIGDVHLGAEEHMEKEWKSFCEAILNNPKAYLLLCGDLMNNAIKSSVSDVYAERIPSRKQHSHAVYCIAMTHGAGGGIFTGASVNRAERFGNVIDGADILITGHTHKAHATKPMKLRVDLQHGVVTPRPYYSIGVGSWMRYGGYAMRKMLLPSSPALQIIKLGRIGRTIEVTTL